MEVVLPSDPLEPRGLAQFAAELGFGSAALFSRSFRARFGLSPDAYRTAVVRTSDAARPGSVEPAHAWWAWLGRRRAPRWLWSRGHSAGCETLRQAYPPGVGLPDICANGFLGASPIGSGLPEA